MSNDGNKSTRRVPFTMFSSSAEGGYLEDFSTNFTGGVTVANMHTDTYGEFRNPPMQGPFTEAMVGGEQRRHIALNTGNDGVYDRAESFEVTAESGGLTLKTQREAASSRLLSDMTIVDEESYTGYAWVNGGAFDGVNNFIYWSNDQQNKIQRSYPGSGIVYDLVENAGNGFGGIGLDVDDNKIYFVKIAPSSGVYQVQRCTLNGTASGGAEENVSTNTITNAEDLDLDIASGYAYFTRYVSLEYRMFKIKMDTSESATTGSLVLNGARYISIDQSADKVYFVDGAYNVKRANLQLPAGETADTRTDVETLITAISPVGIAVDSSRNKLYLTDFGGRTWSANTDGSGLHVMHTIDGESTAPAIDDVNNRLFFTCRACNGTPDSVWKSSKLDGYDMPKAVFYRDAFAKRPVNIRNIKKNSPGNYSQEYEVVQIAGRTLNPRHYAEYPEQYTTDFAQNFGTEGRVLNTIDADGEAATGTLEPYTLPDNTGSTNNFVFVNKFSAPGDRYTMSRGFLNPKGEEMSIYNASPFRNLNVRAELSEDLATHTPKATDIPPDSPTKYHTTNRNTKFAKKDSAQNIQKIAVESASAPFKPDSFAIDHEAGYIYIASSGTKILRTDVDGNSSTQVLYDLGGGHYLMGIAIDTESGKMYFTDSTTSEIYIANLDGTGTPSVLYSTTAGVGNLRHLALDLINGKIYYSDNTFGSGIFRYDIDGTSVSATPIVTGLDQPYGIAVDAELGRVYYTDHVSFGDGFIGVCGLNGEDPRTLATSTSPLGLSLDTKLQKIYWADDDDNTVSRMNTDGTESEVVLSFSSTGFGGFRSVVLDAESGYLYFGNELSYPNASIERAPAPEKPIYDNANVTHAIPQSSLQYTWIKDSAETTISEFQGYATGSDIQFYSNSVGFDSPMNNVYIDPINATQSFDFTGSVYTYGTWKEIRGGELGLSRYYRNHNILPVANGANSVTQYIEPPVVAKNQPLEYILAIDGTGAPYSIRSAYGSKLQRYSNEEINKLYDTDVSDANTEYAKIRPLYLDKSISDPNNPVKQFYSLIYGETVFPKSKNAYMKKVRLRGEYTEVAGTGINGYDRRYGLQNTFYRTTGQRSEGALNSQGFAPSTQTAVTSSITFDHGTEWKNYSHQLGKDLTSGVRWDTESFDHAFIFGNQGDHSFSKTRYLALKDPVIGAFTASFLAIKGPYAGLEMSGNAAMSPPTTPTLLLSARRRDGETFTYGNPLISVTSNTDWYNVSFHVADFAEPTYVWINQLSDSFLGFSDTHIAIKELTLKYIPASASAYQAFQPMHSSGTGSLNNSASFDGNVGELNSDTDETITSTDRQPSMAFTEELALYAKPMTRPVSPSLSQVMTSSGYTERLVETISGKVPSNDTYEGYAENEIHAVKEASILPEFRISEYMKRYVEDDNGNFRKVNKDFLTILGAQYSASAESTGSVYFDSDFEDTYMNTDVIENYKKIREDHIGHSSPKKLTIRAKGVKKLLPYNGFYPSPRAVQIGAELSSSLSEGLSSYTSNALASIVPGSTPTTTAAPSSIGTFGLAKVMNSPGILYNSIKGGIAVDYPSFTTSPARENDISQNKTGDMSISTSPDLRIPFESLYNLERSFPIDRDVYVFGQGDKYESCSDSPSYYFRWNGEKKPTYELAMHNYLSECVSFFLQNGSLNSFISAPETEFMDVVANMTYSMDIVLDDATQNNKFLNPKGTKEKFGYFNDIVDENIQRSDTLAGWSTDIVAGPNGDYFTVTGAPQFSGSAAAPSIEQGKVYFKHTDASGNVTDLDPSGILKGDAAEKWYGYSTSICSGSEGVYFIVGAPGTFASAVNTGRVHMYRYTDGAGLVELAGSPKPVGVGNSYSLGVAVKCVYSDATNLQKIFFAAIDRKNDSTTNGSILSLYRTTNLAGGNVSSAVATQEFADTDGTNFMNYRLPLYGLDMKVLEFTTTPANNELLIITSNPGYDSGGSTGAVSGAYYDGSYFTTGFGPLTDPSVDSSYGGWGTDVSIVEAQNNDDNDSQGYVAVGRSNPMPLVLGIFTGDLVTGSVGIYRTVLDSSTGVQIQASTTLNGRVQTKHDTDSVLSYDASFGSRVNLQYEQKTGDLILGATQPYWSWGTPGMVGGVRVAGSFEKQRFMNKSRSISGDTYVFPTSSLEQWINPSFESDGWWILNSSFGGSLNVAYDGDNYLASVGSPYYSGSLSQGGIAHAVFGSASYHDYKQDGKLFGMPIDGYYDPAYCAYTPPGFYGQSVARIAYSSSIGGATSLDEIFSKAEVVETIALTPSRQRYATGSTQAALTTLQDESKMPMSASLSLFGKVFNPAMEFSVSEDGTTTRADRATSAGPKSPRWAISTKFEAPVINISSSDYADNYTSYNNELNSAFLEVDTNSFSYDTPQSVWTSYSENPAPTNKYTLSLRDTYTKEEAASLGAGSLIDLCGFTPGVRNIGSVAENRQFKEAIMVIPYTSRAIKGKTTKIEEGVHFFKVGKRELNRQKRSVEDNGYAISEEIISTSISQMISGMKEYVIPPQYNFLQYDDIHPFASYFLEFDHDLTQKDLADIWQGVSPSIAINPEIDEVEITHKIDKHNLFYNVEIPNDIKFMIFKVKYKAEWNYYSITTDSTDDDRFKFDFKGDGEAEIIPEYSYNWPYDYCSLVERAKVDVEFTFKKNGDDEDLPGEE